MAQAHALSLQARVPAAVANDMLQAHAARVQARVPATHGLGAYLLYVGD